MQTYLEMVLFWAPMACKGGTENRVNPDNRGLGLTSFNLAFTSLIMKDLYWVSDRSLAISLWTKNAVIIGNYYIWCSRMIWHIKLLGLVLIFLVHQMLTNVKVNLHSLWISFSFVDFSKHNNCHEIWQPGTGIFLSLWFQAKFLEQIIFHYLKLTLKNEASLLQKNDCCALPMNSGLWVFPCNSFDI